MSRSSHLIVLTLLVQTPISHGSGTAGNEQILRTQEYLLPDPEAPSGWRKVAVPEVSGASVKATLREHAVLDMLEILGIAELSKDKLRLLLKGGQNGPGGQSVSLDEARRLRELFPLLAVFGSMDGGMPIRGQITVSPARPWCAELVEEGLIPRRVLPLHVVVDDETPSGMGIELLPGVAPVPMHMLAGRNEYFRHDLRTSPAAQLLSGAVVAQIEDKAAARKGKSASKEERREANESMPHSYQTILPGAHLIVEIRLEGATEVELGCLARAVVRWAGSGGHLGGAVSRGHGQCQVSAAGHIAFQPGRGVAVANGADLVDIGQRATENAGTLYVAHLHKRAGTIATEVLA